MSDWEDRRNEPRLRVDAGQISVIDPEDGQPLGALANLSRHGLMLNSAAPFTAQASYQALLCWPRADGTEQHIAVGIHALWCSTGPADSHWTGFEVIDISDTDQARLDDLIATTCS